MPGSAPPEGPGRSPSGAGIVARVFERFTDRARSVLVLAQEEARLLRHSYIGTEHILLGLILEGEGVAATALASLGITLEAVRGEVEEMVGAVDETTELAPGGSPPFTPRSKKVLELSLREALHLGHNYIGTEHILLGIIREGDGVAAQVLPRLGVDLGVARRRITAIMAGGPIGMEATSAGKGSVVTHFTNVERPNTEPRCPQCRADLADGTRFRTILVQPDATEGEKDPLLTRVVYCRRCGVSLHVFMPGP